VTQEQIDMVIDLMVRQPPAIAMYNGFFHLSDDVRLFDGDKNEYVGHAIYRWSGEEDEPQVASWENFVCWWIAEDGETTEISNSIVLWLPKE